MNAKVMTLTRSADISLATCRTALFALLTAQVEEEVGEVFLAVLVYAQR